MIQKTFSEGIYLENEGPVSSSTVKSSYNQNVEKSYISAVSLVPKLVPKRTFFAMNGALPKVSSATFNRSCSFSSLSDGEKSYESSVFIDETSTIDDINSDGPFYQNIELEARLIPNQFSETINNFPKTDDHSYSSTFSYDPFHVKESYMVGLRVEKVREITFSMEQEKMEAFTSSMHLKVVDEDEYEKAIVNGECKSPGLVNGMQQEIME